MWIDKRGDVMDAIRATSLLAFIILPNILWGLLWPRKKPQVVMVANSEEEAAEAIMQAVDDFPPR